MKKFILGLLLLVSVSMYGQELGLRFGNVPVSGESNNVAIDGIFSIGEFSRVHADVSFGDGVGLDALWDFVYRPLGGEEFYWYAGFGASLFIGDDFWFGVPGEIGLEYGFNSVPIVIGLDYRPTLWFIDDFGFEWGGFGLNVRWKFN